MKVYIYMYKAFHMKLRYNLQAHFLFEKTMKLKQDKAVHLDKFIYAQQQNNTVFQLLVLNYGIAMKNLVEIAKRNRFLRQDTNIV